MHAVLLDLGADPAEQPAGGVEGLRVLLAGPLAQAPEEVELALGDPEVDVRLDLGAQSRKPGLKVSRRAVGSCSFGTVAMNAPVERRSTRTRPCGG